MARSFALPTSAQPGHPSKVGTPTTLLGVWGLGTTFIAAGEEGTLLRSTDAGETWSTVPTGTAALLFGVSGSGWTFLVVGEHGTILRSPEAGASWEALSSGVDHFLTDVWMPDQSNAVVVGFGGLILRGES